MTQPSRGGEYDVAVIGGGLVGSALAWGLARAGQKVAMLDEGDIAVRPSRGNFALVWVQGKGLGMPEYAGWTKKSSDDWSGFADLLREQTGLDVAYRRPGGFMPMLSEEDLQARANTMMRLHNQPDMIRYPYEVMDRETLRKELPFIGPDVVGGTYCPLDGHCNSLRLLRTLHKGIGMLGVEYRPNHRVERIEHRDGGFRMATAGGEIRAGKIVLAAGHDSARLAPMVGLSAPVRPQRGHVIVTEKTAPFLHHPTVYVRQTDEGGVMIGDSFEEAGFDTTLQPGVSSAIAQRAIRFFPLLGKLNVVRSWAALRVLTPDGFPIYEESKTAPGAFVATCHSGVTLAANHALTLAPLIAAGGLGDSFTPFSAGRFHVPQAACDRNRHWDRCPSGFLHHRRPSGQRAGRRQRHRRPAGERRHRLPHHSRERCGARSLLHDGRLLRLPRHHRRHRQPPGLSGACGPRHGGGNPERQARGGAMSAPNPKFDFDIAVVGSGPAGLAAAALAASKGASVVLLDEQAEPGGQIYRAVTETPVRDRKVLGPDYWHGAELLGPLRDSGAAHWPGTIVWSVARPREDAADGHRPIQIGLSRNGSAAMLTVRHVILATGALERPFPIPGWTLPGVLGAGAAQVLLKTSGLVPSGATVMAGSGPLLWLLAWQYLQAGVRIDAILDTTPKENWRAALPLLPGFLRSPYWAKGMKLMLEVRRKLTVIGNVTALRAEGAIGGDSALKSVVYTRNGTEHRLPADTLLLHHGVIPNLNLANATGCAQRWDEQQRCWRPTTDEWGATSVEGVSLAGDGAGIGGARAAEEAGRLAALDALHRLGRIGRDQRDQAAVPFRAALDRALTGRAFLDTLYTPAEAFRAPADDTIVCRCEEITAGAVREAVRLGCSGPNQAKSFLRCGMGPCQGRLCGPTVTEVIAAERGVSPAEVGYYRLRPPVKPITLAELAALPKTDADIDAVFKHCPEAPDDRDRLHPSCRHRHRRRPPRLLRGAASVDARRARPGSGEGPCRPPRLRRQCGRRAPARPPCRRGAAVRRLDGAVAPHPGSGGRRLRLRKPRPDQGGGERGGAGDLARPRRRTQRVGLHPRGGGRAGRAALAGAGHRRPLRRRAGVARRRGGDPLPHHLRLPPQGHRARCPLPGRRGGDAAGPQGRPVDRRDRRRRPLRGPSGGERRRRLGRPHRRPGGGAGAAGGDRADADDHRPRRPLHQAGGRGDRPHPVLQAVPQRHRADRRRAARPGGARREPDGAGLLAGVGERPYGVGPVPVHARRHHRPLLGGDRGADAGPDPGDRPQRHRTGPLPFLRFLRARLPAWPYCRAHHRRPDHGRVHRPAHRPFQHRPLRRLTLWSIETVTIQRFHLTPRLCDMVIHKDTVYLAGQIVDDGSTTVEAQTRDVLRQIDALLAQAGTSKSNLLTATVYLADIATFPEMNAAWDAWVDKANPPARATVEARLADPSILVEIVVVAGL